MPGDRRPSTTLVSCARSRRALAGAAATTLLLAVPVLAGATPVGATTAPTAPAAQALPKLPAVPRTWTDGLNEQALYRRAVALVAVGQRSAPLQNRISQSKARLDADAVIVSQATAAAHTAAARAAADSRQAGLAAAAYQSLASTLRDKVLQLYTGEAVPSSVTVDASSGNELAVAAGYLQDALGPGATLAQRAAELATDRAATRDAASEQAAAQTAQHRAEHALADERTTAATLEADLRALDSGAASAATSDGLSLTAQIASNLDSPSALQFTPAHRLPAPLATTTTALTWAFAELGVPYLWGGTGPEFDCSGLTQFVWKKAGVTIPRVAADQDAWTDPVPLSQLTPGDLVFYGTTYIHHVGIYIGDGLMINAPHTGTSVQVSSIWWSDLAGFGRVHANGTPVASHQLPTRTHPLQPVVRGNKKVPSQPGPALPPHRHAAGHHHGATNGGSTTTTTAGGGSTSTTTGGSTSTTTTPGATTTTTPAPTTTTTEPPSTTTTDGGSEPTTTTTEPGILGL